MKKRTLLGSLLVSSTLVFTGMSGTAQADDVDEEEGAKTVWGEILPPETDPDGDGWANTGFEIAWMSQEAQDRINDLAYEKDFGDLSQVEFNEKVAAIYQKEQQLQAGENNGQTDMTQEEVGAKKERLAELALYSPETLNAAPIQDAPYNYNFFHDGYEFHFSYDGTYWKWSYEPSKNFTDDELIYLAHNHPEKLNEKPVKPGAYDFHLYDHEHKHVYHFSSDGETWSWSYKKK
ncbi:hypothetical protein [Salinicoccus luteus]|uniref:hypothetical protein n=1 Tax=Salinicoccus luteus TaxID=367840 RepID=UPI00068E446B|nr:hypothetical protein [Salinicoccus luteus]